ncbi:MAG: hypothetical protein JWL81_1379 [Verrucomicrobiales bacterium]|nr:hypothetical protein [Verrucomicrobiales bacterium]
MFFRFPHPRISFHRILLLIGILSVAAGSVSAQTLAVNNDVVKAVSLLSTTVTMTGKSELQISGTGDPLAGSVVHLNSPDAWLILTNFAPSQVVSTFLSRVRVTGAAAVADTNVRVVQFGMGAVVIPHSPSYQPLEIFDGRSMTGMSKTLGLYTYHTDSNLGQLRGAVSSFRLKRGYMATFAQQPNGTGMSRVFIAQDGDLEVGVLPSGLDNAVRFVRVVPWRWTGKKGWAGGSGQNMKPLWDYNWNNSKESSRDVEYVPIRQTQYWPGLPNDKQNVTHLLGFNEPDHADQANMSVATAIAAWPELLGCGLRLGAPAVSDGGLSWLYDFIDQCDALGYRVDYVPVHYYRSFSNPADPDGAATQMYNFLKGVADRTKRPVWVTEWNNGANWTSDPDPTYAQQQAAVARMIEMMDNAPFVERYSVYNWVEDVRRMVWDDGWPLAAGETYRDNASPVFYQQELAAVSTPSTAHYLFDGNTGDASGNGHDAMAAGIPDYAAGRAGQGIRLDGTDSYVQLPPRLGDSTDFTFAAWVFWNGGANWQRIVDLGDGTQKHLFLTPKSGSGNLRFTIKNGGGEQQLNSTAALPVGVWTHVAVTLSGDTGKLFVNGAVVNTSTSITINPGDLGTRLNYLGKSQFADPLFSGILEDVRIHNTALTDAQVAALVPATPPAFSAAVLDLPAATPLLPWTDSLAALATGGGAGVRTFSKVGGPGWLAVAPDGRLTGVPLQTDVGMNTFEVRVTVPSGAAGTAMVRIPVAAPEGLVARFPFSGNPAAAVGGRPGVTTGGPAYVSGKYGLAVNLDGVDDSIALPAGIANSPALTVAAWFYWTTPATWQRIFDFGNGTAEHIFLTPRTSSNRMALTIRKGATETTVDTTMPSVGVWTHVAATIGGGSIKLFVNGNLAASGVTALSPPDIRPAANFVGKSQFADPLLSGRVDEFLVFNKALAPSEITELLTAQAPVFSGDPINRPAGAAGSVYEQTMAGTVTDPNPNSWITYQKSGGPRWLTVDGYGRFSGQPGASDAGQNRFLIRATDATGLASETTLLINVPSPADALGIWHFDNNLTNQIGGTGTASGGPAYDTGWFDRALRFDAADDFATLPSGLLGTAADFTLAARVRWDGGGSWQRLFDFGVDTTKYLMITPQSGGGTLRFAIKNTAAEQVLDGPALTPGDWAHVAVTLAGNTGTLYFNGTAVDSKSITIDPSAINPTLNYLGESQFASDPLFAGVLDEMRIFRRGLSAAEVASLAFPPVPVLIPDNSYEAWAVQQAFGTPAGSGAAADPDADGMVNLLEFLLGTDPLGPDSGVAMQGGVATAAELGGATVSGKTYLTWRARVLKIRPNIKLEAETAASLTDFATSVPAVQVADPVADGAFETIIWYHPVALEDSPGGRAFIRLRVTKS